MKRSTLSILGALAATAALAACSTSGKAPGTAENDAGAPEPIPTVEEPETMPLNVPWTAETATGAVLSVEFGVDPTDERVAALEDFRVAMNAEPVSYTVVDLDNRPGTEYQNLYPSQIFDAEGEATELLDAPEAAEEWAPETIWTDDETDYHSVDASGETISDERAVELNEAWGELDLESGADPAQRVDIILVGPEDLPDEAAAVLLRDASAYPAEG